MVNFKEVAKRIANEKENMATYITEEQVRKYPEQLGPISSVLHEERVKLIGLYEELLQIDMEAALEKITQWGRETGAFCSGMGMTIDMALDELNYYREKMTDIIFDAADTKCHDLKIYHKAVLKLQRIIDQAAQSFSVAFVNHHFEMMNKARREIAELSVPVVPLEKGVAVLPLIGTIDTYRAKLLMEESLSKSSLLGVRYFIMDLSGVPIVDTMIASQIFQVLDALKLLGVNGVISGIRPEIAQTMVALGIDFSTVQTYSSLQQALENKRNF